VATRAEVSKKLISAGIEGNPGPIASQLWRRALDAMAIIPLQSTLLCSFATSDVAWEALLIKLQLLRAGVEPNPGPELKAQLDPFGALACPMMGKLVKGEFVKIGSTSYLVCSCCSARLHRTDPNLSKYWGTHSDQIIEEQLVAVVEPVVVDNPREVARQERASSSCHRVSSHLVEKLVSVFHPLKPTTPPKQPEKLTTPWRPCLSGTDVPFSVKAAVLGRGLGVAVDLLDFQEQRVCVEYVGDRRILTNQNVTEAKLPFDAVCIAARAKPITWQFYMLAGFLAITVGALLCPWGDLLPWTDCEEVEGKFHHCSYLATHYISNCLDPELIDEYLSCAPQPQPIARWIGLFVSAPFWLIAFIIWPKKPKEGIYVVNYIPHLVACVLHEYDRGTNAVAARSTLRQRLRRLAAFPLAAVDHDKFLAGTEEICMQMLSDDLFFWAGATCFTPPR
jgi:hypothetical protein